MRVSSEQDLDQLYRAVQAWAVISAWAGGGQLEALADGAPRRLDSLPGDPRALAVTAPILVHVGLLVMDGGGRCALSGAGRELLEQGVLAGASAEARLGDLSRLDAVLREGGPARGPDGTSRVTEGGVREEDREGARRFLAMLFRRSERGSREVVRWLAPRLADGARILDLGGGHGRYADELTAAGFRVELFDRPLVVDIARERHGDRLDYRAGDFLADELGGPFDAVLLSNIVHGLGEGELAPLFARVAGALGRGGLIVLKDMFVDDHGADPAEAIFFGLQMLLYTRQGRTYSVADMRRLLAGAGFPSCEHIYLRDIRFSLLIAARA
ncbi:MAG TPA: methyltransferase [Kofleriaceae bacterium]|nr:methyltransferase [Kofleriaceae bacterium]